MLIIPSIIALSAASTVLAGPARIQKRQTAASSTPAVRPRLGSMCNWAVVSMSGVSTVQTSDVEGDIALSPIAITGATGFDLFGPPLGPQWSSQVCHKNCLVTGPDSPGSTTPLAVQDMMTAFNDGANQAFTTSGQPLTPTPGYPASYSEAFAGSIPDGAIFKPGVYFWSTVVSIPVGAKITLQGSCTDTFIFIFNSLNTGANSQIVLGPGLSSGSVFWVSHSTLTTGANSLFQGIILAKTNVVIGTGGTLNGIIGTQTEVALHVASVNQPEFAGASAVDFYHNGISGVACTPVCSVNGVPNTPHVY